jgi:hypothetical protein
MTNIDPKYGTDITRTIQKATEQGQMLVAPAPNQLFIDIDNEADLANYQALVDILEVGMGKLHVEVFQSKSSTGVNANRHIVITLPRRVTPIERIAYQACLGSDRKRELLSLLCVEAGHLLPTVFYRDPPKADDDKGPY